MRKRCQYQFVSLLCIWLATTPGLASAKTNLHREYQIKAAFLYNFTKFVNWPKDKVNDSNTPFIIGILGKDPFGNAFMPVMNKPLKGKKLLIRRFKGYEQLRRLAKTDKSIFEKELAALRRCHLIFVCSSEKEHFKKIVSWVRDHPILTVADKQGFLQAGGVIELLMEQNKVRFEVNMQAATRAKITLRSQLLRLARKIHTEAKEDKN